jgi:glutamate decarboxylase
VGWVIWRSKKYLPKDLIFELHYLGSVEYSFSLNFSRPAAPIIAQYFMLLHLGFAGYRAVALQDLKNARTLSRALERSGYYEVLSDIHRLNSPESVTDHVKHTLGVDEEDVEVSYVGNIWVFCFNFWIELRSWPSCRRFPIL